jgi:hypothetical protein
MGNKKRGITKGHHFKLESYKSTKISFKLKDKINNGRMDRKDEIVTSYNC